MQLVKYHVSDGPLGIGQLSGDRVLPLNLSGKHYNSLFDILEADDPLDVAQFLVDPSASIGLASATLVAPIDNQEVWAAGVTYLRSQSARMEESETSASCYDLVYRSDRPELFFKATPHRVAGPGMHLKIRADSQWNVPEPELTLVLNTRLDLVGFTIGNDMSSRDIEGENPLYLPQAKVYDACCGLGPCITLASAMPPKDSVNIELIIRREGETVFQGQTSLSQMAREYDNLIDYLGRDNTFPQGVFLLTGTGIVPDSDFTLQPGDTVGIAIDGIGTLINEIIQDA